MLKQKRPLLSLINAMIVSGILLQPAYAAEGDHQRHADRESNSGTGENADVTDFSEDSVGKLVPDHLVTQALSKLKRIRPNLSITDVRFSPLENIYKASLQGNSVFFSADGRFFIVGEMYQVMSHQLVNLQQQERHKKEAAFAPRRAKLLDAVAKEDMIIFPAAGDTKAHVSVFTDIDCGFCRKLHRQVPEMQARGIEVRYLGFPRAGIDSNSAKKLVTTWCSDDAREVMTQFKQGENVALKSCKPNPIADHYMLGQKVGVRGTPAIVLSSGQIVPGAISTKQLVSILKEANLYP